MTPLAKTKNIMRDLLEKNKVAEVPAWLGDLYTGQKKADDNGNIYVTFMGTGEVVEVYNDIAPLILQLQVIIGYDKSKSDDLRVLKLREPFPNKPFLSLPNHAPTHEAFSHDMLFIRREQWVPGLSLPIPGTLTVKLMADDYYLNNGWHSYPTQILDLSGQIPASGANIVLAEIDEDGVITYNAGASYASRALLDISKAPTMSAGKIVVGIYKVYLGQTEFIFNRNDTDILDPRFAFRGSGSLPSFDPLHVAAIDDSGALIAAPGLWYKDPTPYVGQVIHGENNNDVPVIGDYAESRVVEGQIARRVDAVYSDTLTDGAKDYGYRAGGTKTAPTTTLANMMMKSWAVIGQGVSMVWSNTRAKIEALADGDWSGTSQPTRIEIWTTAIGSVVDTLAAIFTSDHELSMEGHKIINVADPSAAQDVATKAYVDASGGGIPIVSTDPVSPSDGQAWLLRTVIPAHADGEAMGPLGLTYTGDSPGYGDLILSFWDDVKSNTGRVQLTYD